MNDSFSMDKQNSTQVCFRSLRYRNLLVKFGFIVCILLLLLVYIFDKNIRNQTSVGEDREIQGQASVNEVDKEEEKNMQYQTFVDREAHTTVKKDKGIQKQTSVEAETRKKKKEIQQQISIDDDDEDIQDQVSMDEESIDIPDQASVKAEDIETQGSGSGLFVPPPGEVAARRFPQAVVAGFPKCGTRAILTILCMHPYVRCYHKEVHFYDQHFDLGYNWYQGLMPETFSNQVTLEKTPAYVSTARARTEMKLHFPKIKIIVLVRDPVTRIMSAHAQKLSKEIKAGYLTRLNSKPVSYYFTNESGEIDAERYCVKVGCYSEHLREWYKIFPERQILVMDTKDLISQPLDVMKMLEIFLEIPRLFSSKNFLRSNSSGFYCFKQFSEDNENIKCLDKSKGKGREHKELPVGDEEQLYDFYKPYNEKLFEMIKQRFNWTHNF